MSTMMNKRLYVIKYVSLLAIVFVLASCAGDSGGVVDTVLVDFGMKAKPEGYIEPSDKIYARLDEVGKAEMRRMNLANQKGEIKFQAGDGLTGQYYKEVKAYEEYRPVDAQAVNRQSQAPTNYVGFVEYHYAIYQSVRKGTRTDADAESASIRTGVTGREKYRYRFGSGGEWNGAAGERVKE